MLGYRLAPSASSPTAPCGLELKCLMGRHLPRHLKEIDAVFFRYPEIQEGSLAPEKAERVEHLAAKLPSATVAKIRRRFVALEMDDGEKVEADVSNTGITFYLGGFDWITFQTPPQVLQHFPEFMPLPQLAYPGADDDGPELEL